MLVTKWEHKLYVSAFCHQTSFPFVLCITTLLSFFFDKLWLVRFYYEICCMESEAKYLYFKFYMYCQKLQNKGEKYWLEMFAQFKNQVPSHGTSKKLSEKWSKKSKAVETKLSGLNLQISNYWKCRWLGLTGIPRSSGLGFRGFWFTAVYNLPIFLPFSTTK